MASILPQTAFRALRTLPRAAAPLPRAAVRPSVATHAPRMQQPLLRRFNTNIPQEQPRLRLGATGRVIPMQLIDGSY